MNDLRTILERWGIPTQTLYHWLDTDRGPITCLQARVSQCPDLWGDLHALVAETGHYPIILGGDESLAYHRAKIAEWQEESTTAILNRAARLNLGGWMKRRRVGQAQWIASFHEPWPEGQTPRRALCKNWYRGTPQGDLHVGLLPVRQGWEALALLRFGWKRHPPRLIDHVALHQFWHERYGADVAYSGPDELECVVQRPPTDRASALSLAEEHFIYCEDAVDQSVRSLERLAAMLLNGTVWHFWWD
jgi:hypothetical protein